MPEKPNIVLLVLDTLRAKNVSCYGYDAKTTPNIDRLAETGVQYQNAYTVSPWTLPAHASLFTGRYPSEHQANARTKELDETFPTIAERLSEAGYGTVAVSNNVWLTPDRGMDRGFDTFDLMWQRFDTPDIATPIGNHQPTTRTVIRILRNTLAGNPVKRFANLVHGYRYQQSRRRAEATNDRILARIDDTAEPFFLFANFMEPHLPYRPPQEHAERFLPNDVSYNEAMQISQQPWDYVFGDQEYTAKEFEILEALYNAAVNYLDEQIGALVDDIKERTDRRTIIIITSDHGENIGDHGLMAHQYSLEDTVLHIPLIFVDPKQEAEQIEEQTSLIDLHARILEDAGINADCRRPESTCFAQYLEPTPPLFRLQEKYGITEEALDGRQRMEAARDKTAKLVTFTDRRELRDNDDNMFEDAETQQKLEDALADWHSRLHSETEPTETALDTAIKNRLERLGYY